MSASLSEQINAGVAQFLFAGDSVRDLRLATIPLVFAKMPAGGLFTVVFFVLASIATIGAMVSIMEVPVAWFTERGHLRRPVAAAITGAIMMVLGVLATLSQSPVLAEVKPFGKNFFDLFDFVSSNVLLPVGGVAISLVAGWLIPKATFLAEAEKGEQGSRWHVRAVYGAIRWVAPVLTVLILLSSLGVIRLG